MPRLPFLISIPHSGRNIPEELAARISLSPEELLADGDPYTDRIYDVCKDVRQQIHFEIARAIIDVNRAPDDLPPDNPDGVLKTVSIFNNLVYVNGREPGKDEIVGLLEKYYEPYHKRIWEASHNSEISFAFDCHSMEAVGPAIAKDSGRKRPLFCLGDNGGKSCSNRAVRLFAECISEAFSVPSDSITINEPFSGGYITRKYGNNPFPWIQVEMNRALYLAEPWYDPEYQTISDEKLQELNSCFRMALLLFDRYNLKK